MQIKVQYPVQANAIPPGLQKPRTVFGSMLETFEIPDVTVEMTPLVTLTNEGNKATIEFAKGEDGHTYRKYEMPAGFNLADGSVLFKAFFNNRQAPLYAKDFTRMQEVITSNKDRLKAEFYPLDLASTYFDSKRTIPELDPDRFRELEFRWRGDREAAARAIANMIIDGTTVYKRCPEPVHALSRDPKSGRISARLWVPNGYEEFDEVLIKDHSVLGFISVGDPERVATALDELVEDIGGGATDNVCHMQVTTYGGQFDGDGYSLKLLALRMQRSATNSLQSTDLRVATANILEWNPTTFDLFRELNDAQENGIWATDLDRLDRIVGKCFDYDETTRNPVFTRQIRGEATIPFDLMRQRWLMRDMEALGPTI